MSTANINGIEDKLERTRSRLTAARRQVEIARAAARVISNRGIPALRLHHVADEAGISQPLVSQHFRSREDLIAAAFSASDQAAYEAIVEHSSHAATGYNRIVSFMDGCLREDPEVTESWILWHQIWAYSSFSPRLDELIRERQRIWMSHCEKLIRIGLEDGSISLQTDPESAALMLIVMLDGVTLSLRYELIDQEMAKNLALRVVRSALNGTSQSV